MALEHAIRASEAGYEPEAIRISPKLIVRTTTAAPQKLEKSLKKSGFSP